jgi:hypothetical protein
MPLHVGRIEPPVEALEFLTVVVAIPAARNAQSPWQLHRTLPLAALKIADARPCCIALSQSAAYCTR